MPTVNIDSARVHYTTRPGGPRPVVFLHGGFGSSAELWDTAMAALPTRYSGYAIDNFLRSDAPPEGYSVPAFARRVGGFIAALGLDKPVLVGHSMGGVTIQLAALEYPDSVGGLVLTCTGAAMPNHQLGRALLADLRAAGAGPALHAALRAISASWFRRPPAGFFDQYVERACDASLAAMIAVQESLLAQDLRPRLHELHVPTLVVHAAHDTGRTIEYAQALVAAIAGSRMVVMEESGHSPMVETPDAYNAALHRFLEDVHG
jgi:pimeloyl-ACP methyl ester carboxylesterase